MSHCSFRLLEDAVLAIDALVWSLIPVSWLSQASVQLKIKKAEALSSFGIPALSSHTSVPNQRSIFVKETKSRFARLAAWDEGALWSVVTDGSKLIHWGKNKAINFCVTKGHMILKTETLNPGDCRVTDNLGVLTSDGPRDLFEMLVYVPTLNGPQVATGSFSPESSQPGVWETNLFQALGIPPSERFEFSELIWAKEQHPHFAAAPQKQRHDIDVDPKVAVPFELVSS